MLDDSEVEENDVIVKGSGKGANMKRAIELTMDPKKLRKAKTNFKTRFLAFNTMQSRNSKRRKVLEVMQNITGMDDPFPVDQELLVGVGTALDEAKLQSGDQYVHEVKLMHLEAGYEWNMPMERQLYLVKNALKRHKGPEVRANEVKTEDLAEEIWNKAVTCGVSHRRPAWSYAFACIWMLRAAEVIRVKAKHLEVQFDPREVCLYIPSSKTDQRGKGTKRTLRCICDERQGCSRWCAWANAVMCLAEHKAANPEAKLFKPAKKNSQPGKAQMVKMWAKHIAKEISGHSARRSGAMYYTRCGMDVAGVMFLGRWKSSAVLRYIEDALQSMPANRKLHAGEDGRERSVSQGGCGNSSERRHVGKGTESWYNCTGATTYGRNNQRRPGRHGEAVRTRRACKDHRGRTPVGHLCEQKHQDSACGGKSSVGSGFRLVEHCCLWMALRGKVREGETHEGMPRRNQNLH